MAFLPYNQLPKILHGIPPTRAHLSCFFRVSFLTRYRCLLILWAPIISQDACSFSYTYYLILITYYYTRMQSNVH
jgi:hypothetical protein